MNNLILPQFYEESGEAMLILTPDLVGKAANPAAVKLFGFKSEENFKDKSLAGLSTPEQDDKSQSDLKIRQMAEIARARKSVMFEWLFQNAQGKALPVRVLLTFLSVEDEEYIFALIHDITAQKETQKAFKESYDELQAQVRRRTEELLEANENLKQEIADHKKAEEERLKLEKDLQQSKKLESIGTLAAGIAHEINTPVQFISDNTQFLATAIADLRKIIHNYRDIMLACDQGPKTAAAIKKGLEFEKEIDLDFIEQEIGPAVTQTNDGLERVSKIVSAMRDFSHIGSEDDKVKADLNKAIESTIIVSRNVWKYSTEMKTDLDPNLPAVNCYLSDVNQVIMNMIVNSTHAIMERFRDETEPQGKIVIRTAIKDKTHVRISIADNGNGIPENIREKIFDPFFTTKEVGKGTGQGLSIAYSSIAEKHGGNITLESQVGKGTVFHIDLPIN